MKRPVATLILMAALGGCGSGPPDEAGIREALERNLADTITAGEELQGKAWAERARLESKVYSVRLTGPCVEEAPKRYRCPVSVDWATPLAPRHTAAIAPLVYRGAVGWTLPVEGDDRYR